MAEELRFDFASTGADKLGRDFKSTGDNAALAAKGARLLSDALESQRKAAFASSGASISLAKADKILADAEHVLADGALEAEFALKKEADAAQQARDAAAEAAVATDSLSGIGGIPGGGLAGVAAAGVALSPVITTLAFGLGGLGLAAAGVAKPIEAAAQKAGGLQANLGSLDSQQRTVAAGILGLGKDYTAFQHALEPVVVKDFAAALGLVTPLLHDVEPVAAATGKALAGTFGSLGAEFKSRDWQEFFGFMAQTAGPDVRALTTFLVQLTAALPPLLEQLQPTAAELLNMAGDAAKLINVTAQASQKIDTLGGATRSSDPFIRGLGEAFQFASKYASPQNQLLAGIHFILGKVDGSAAQVTSTEKQAIPVTQALSAQVQRWANMQKAINGALATGLSPLENYIGAQITERNDLKQLNDALQKSHDRIGLNTQAERDSFSAAQNYIQNTTQTAQAAIAAHKGIGQQITTIENALPVLENVKNKTSAYKQELQLLKQILDKLRAEKNVSENVHFTGYGKTIFPGATHAAGALVPSGFPNDSYPALLTSGETVVPRHLTPAVAPLMRAHGVPGFASGGLVPDYTGTLAGVVGWEPGAMAGLKRAMADAFGKDLINQFRSIGVPGGVATPGLITVAKFMMANGASRAAAAGIAGTVAGESGGNPESVGSGGFGLIGWTGNTIGLPPGYTGPTGNPGRDMAIQLSGMLGYIQANGGLSPINAAGRTGGPLAAADLFSIAYERPKVNYSDVRPDIVSQLYARGYDSGGYLPPGLSLAYNGTGRPEPVTPAGRGGGRVEVVLRVEANAHAYSQFLANEIKHQVRVSGGGDVQVAYGS